MRVRGLRASVEECLWPLVETLFASHELAGLAVAVVRDDEVVSRGFGVRDLGTGTPVTPETMFHLASVSKPFVATAIVSLATARDADRAGARPGCADQRVGARVHAGRRSGRGGDGARSLESFEWSPGRLGVRLARPAAGRRGAQRVRSQPVGLAAEVGARLDVLLLQRRVRAARAAAVQGDRYDVRGRRAAAGPGSARDAGQHLSPQRGARAPGCVTTRRHAAVGPRGRLSLHQAPCSQLEPALQPGRDVSLDGRPLRTRRGDRWELRRAVGSARPRAARPAVAAGGAGGRPSVGRGDGARLGRGQLSRAPGAEPQRGGPWVRLAARAGARAADRSRRPGQLQHRAHRGHRRRPRSTSPSPIPSPRRSPV